MVAKHVFGPVPSRRLGQSLGVDPVPFKICNWNCVYCQLGRTARLSNEREEFFPVEDVVHEVEAALGSLAPGEVDWVTFVGSGETTLHSGLGRMIRAVKARTSLPVAVITNGSLLYLPEVRAELFPADAVLPTLDAGNEKLYRRINRPAPELTFERLVEGLVSFRDVYPGRLWVEVMLLKGWNDGDEALGEIAEALARVRPDEVHVNLPVRPPAESFVSPPEPEALERALLILGKDARVVLPAQGEFDLSTEESVTDAVLSIVTRHPMMEEDLIESLARHRRETVQEALTELARSGKVRVVERYGKKFWCLQQGSYGETESRLPATDLLRQAGEPVSRQRR